MCICVKVCVYVYAYICMYVCMCIYVYVFVCVCVFDFIYVRLCLSMYKCMHGWMYAYVCVYRCMYVSMYVCMYVWLCLHMCVSISTMRVCLTYPVLGFDVCSSIQEELQGRKMASPSSMLEGGQPTLMKTKKTRWRQRILYSKMNQLGKDNQLSYWIIIITNCSYIILKHERMQVGHQGSGMIITTYNAGQYILRFA